MLINFLNENNLSKKLFTMGNGESVQSNPHFTDPYGGNLRSPNESEEVFYPDGQSYINNNGYHKQTNKNIKGSSPTSNRFQDTISPGHSLNSFPKTSNRKYSDVDFEDPSFLSKDSAKPRRNSSLNGTDFSTEIKNPKRLSKQPFYSTWSIKCSDSLSPQPRIGHFYATAPGSNKTYIGFGKHEIDSNSNGSQVGKLHIPTDEIWEFDHKSFLWRRIVIHGINIKEREESVATAVTSNFSNGNNSEKSTIIYVFGGKDKSQFYSDLLMIDTLAGTITTLKSKHGSPPNLAGAFITYYNNKIFVYGGYDKKDNINQTLFIYDIQGNNWTSKNLENVAGRCNASSVTTKDGRMLIYGGQKGETGLLEINLNTLTAKILPTTGLAPIPDYNYGRLLLIKDYLFYFGGKANNKYTMLYTLDLKRNWWFVFYIKPDNETVTTQEGKINDNGLFLIPRIHSFGCCYSEENDSIVAFLGHPEKDPPPLFILYIGDAFGFINMRDDMLSIMNQDPGDANEGEVPIDLNC